MHVEPSVFAVHVKIEDTHIFLSVKMFLLHAAHAFHSYVLNEIQPTMRGLPPEKRLH